MIRLLYMYIDKRDLLLPHVDVVLLIPIGSLSITIRWSLSDQFAVFFDEKITKIRKAIDSVTPQLDITTPTTVQKAALSSLTEASVEEVSKIIMSCKPKSCALDSLPTDILKLTVHLDTFGHNYETCQHLFLHRCFPKCSEKSRGFTYSKEGRM